jgi:hypothetical protein
MLIIMDFCTKFPFKFVKICVIRTTEALGKTQLTSHLEQGKNCYKMLSMSWNMESPLLVVLYWFNNLIVTQAVRFFLAVHIFSVRTCDSHLRLTSLMNNCG